MDRSTFNREDAKYSFLWHNGYREARWQILADRLLKTARKYDQAPTVVDFGFGNAVAMDFFEINGLIVEGVDISSFAVQQQQEKGRRVYHACLDDLSMFEDDQFNIGFSNDVLEHIPEDLVLPSLEEMARVCSDYLFVSVCPHPARGQSQEGENLHLTIKPDHWWREQFQKIGDVHKYRLYFRRSLRYCIDLKFS
jgi:SAM-dependent methyltransferase